MLLAQHKPRVNRPIELGTIERAERGKFILSLRFYSLTVR
jgi:hypothetical protein